MGESTAARVTDCAEACAGRVGDADCVVQGCLGAFERLGLAGDLL